MENTHQRSRKQKTLFKGEINMSSTISDNISDIMIKRDTLKYIGVQMSGGADSTLIAYLIAAHIVKYNLKTRLRRITFGFGNKSEILKKAEDIQYTITKLIGKDIWEDPYTAFYEHKNMHSIKDQLTYLFDNDLIDHVIHGVTKNPPIEELPDHENTRMVERDEPVLYDNEYWSAPFYNLTKDVILQEYFNLGIESLLFDTCSCDANISPKLIVPCGACWWCKERQWAFNKIGKLDDNSPSQQ